MECFVRNLECRCMQSIRASLQSLFATISGVMVNNMKTIDGSQQFTIDESAWDFVITGDVEAVQDAIVELKGLFYRVLGDWS